MTATSVRWGAFAAIGLLVAVAVALLATQLVSEKIGIASEPVSAGESLVPERVEHQPEAEAASSGREHSGPDDFHHTRSPHRRVGWERRT